MLWKDKIKLCQQLAQNGDIIKLECDFAKVESNGYFRNIYNLLFKKDW